MQHVAGSKYTSAVQAIKVGKSLQPTPQPTPANPVFMEKVFKPGSEILTLLKSMTKLPLTSMGLRFQPWSLTTFPDGDFWYWGANNLLWIILVENADMFSLHNYLKIHTLLFQVLGPVFELQTSCTQGSSWGGLTSGFKLPRPENRQIRGMQPTVSKLN